MLKAILSNKLIDVHKAYHAALSNSLTCFDPLIAMV